MSNRESGVYEFGLFRLDLAGRVLTRDGHAVALAPKTFELLLLMVQGPGRAFSKQVDESAVARHVRRRGQPFFQISVLRKALGEEGARWIETVPKHGYRFGGDVNVIPSADPASRASAEVSSASTPVRLVTAGKRAWWIAAIAASGLALVSYLVLSRGSRTETIRTAPAKAVPLTAYQGFDSIRASRRMAARWHSPGTVRPKTTTTST